MRNRMKQMIIEVDEGANVYEMSESILKAMQELRIQFPDARMIGTKPVNGKQLTLIMAGVDGKTLQDLLDNGYPSSYDDNGEPVIEKFDLGWRIVAEEGVKVGAEKILPYMNDEPVYSDDGELIESKPATSIVGKLQTYAGKKWIY